jgi:hypothetical protein
MVPRKSELTLAADPAEVLRRYYGLRFAHFLSRWHFVNREIGDVSAFTSLWDGQADFAALMEKEPWLFVLKAGKLGFTELECAFDAWRLLFGHPFARVHLFSKDSAASAALLRIVRFGLRRLPPSWGMEVLAESQTRLEVRTAWMDPPDRRTVVSYASTTTAAIDQTAAHTHLDELAQMADPEALWNSVSTTVSPEGGTLHIITRGAGPGFVADLYVSAKAGGTGLYPFFSPYSQRPRPAGWREQEGARIGTVTGLARFAPEQEADALQGDGVDDYIPLARWDSLVDPAMPAITHDDALVLGVDAAVTSDCFGVVVVSRGSRAPETTAAIRACRVWRPNQFPDGRIDFAVPDRWIRYIVEGGCRAGHPRSRPSADCDECTRDPKAAAPHNVVQIAYDQYQLEDMAQGWKRDGLCWVSQFDQGTERLIGDARMYSMAMKGTLAHNGDPDLRDHIANAKAKVSDTEDSRMRIIKRAPDKKVDLVVAAAMAVHRVMDLNLA